MQLHLYLSYISYVCFVLVYATQVATTFDVKDLKQFFEVSGLSIVGNSMELHC